MADIRSEKKIVKDSNRFGLNGHIHRSYADWFPQFFSAICFRNIDPEQNNDSISII
jgi:hypothetical protein